MEIPLILIPIEPDGCHAMIHASINGFKTNVLVDTGASKTILDIKRAKLILNKPDIRYYARQTVGMGSANIKTWTTHIPAVRIGDYVIRDLQVVLIDLKTINDTYAVHDLPRIDMVLGGDLLQSLGAVIDYQKKCLKINKIN